MRSSRQVCGFVIGQAALDRMLYDDGGRSLRPPATHPNTSIKREHQNQETAEQRLYSHVKCLKICQSPSANSSVSKE